MSDRRYNRFLKFHAKHPQVYRLFCEFAKKAVATGRTRYSARTIMEVIRWNTTIESSGVKIKINDNFTPYYVRMFEQDYPQHVGFFEKRVAIADSKSSTASLFKSNVTSYKPRKQDWGGLD